MTYRTAQITGTDCFHCGLPVPAGADYPIRHQGQQHAACCAGCQAVAQTIVDSGLGDYYKHRAGAADKATPLPTEILEQIRLYDSPEIQKSFVRTESGDIREAALILEGITCAACVWLNERHLTRLVGVLSVDINYTTHRALVRWDDSQVKLSRILQAVADIGYHAHPFDAARQDQLAQKERKQALIRLYLAGLSMMQVMMYAVPVYMAHGDMSAESEQILRWASLVLTLPVILYSSLPFYKGTLKDIKAGRAGMDVPVAIGVLTAFLASVWATVSGTGEVYFDSVSMFVFLLLGGRYLEMIARRKAGAAVEQLVKLIPAFAHRLPHYPQSREAHEAAVATLSCGDVLLVKPGETIPIDSTVIEGSSGVDESLLSGESRAIAKQVGDPVIGGAVNIDGPLVVRVDKTGQDTALSAIVRLLDRAMAEKPRLAQLADRVSAWFVTALLLVAALTFAGWYLHDAHRALWITVSVLVISCPCALSLATPAALAAATGRLTQLGMLVARGHALETLAGVTHVVFDKTGTLTYGRMRLLDILPLGGLDAAMALERAARLEQGSPHPIAKALFDAVGKPDLPAADALGSETGMGIEGVIAGEPHRLGRAAYVAQLVGQPLPAMPADWHADASHVYLGQPGCWLAVIAIGDDVRPEAPALLQRLRATGQQLVMLSGDREQAVHALAQRLGIDDARAALTPGDKLAAVQALQQSGAVVAMLGDGVNDAPVLASAQVSIALGSGTDVARASADMVLMNNQLPVVADALDIARRCRAIIRQNLWWALCYNLVALPLAITGLITPWLASIGMAGSSLLVVGNALRLLGPRTR
ncbi:heavy metal translocating P-type ATPase [Chitinivorax sp. PXF-14]|uniref:heavy metal translocating P-type ATPase n=1 Tax=Chitinivorax sp. PXF-14 TaxID=3230488 RepID=UPI0034676C23